MTIHPIFHIRVESANHGELNYFSFYNSQAPNKHDAGLKARKQFAEDFGGKYENNKVGYTWDEGIHVDLKRIPAI